METDYETHPGFFKILDNEFNFTLDVCSEDYNAKCKNFYTPQIDGLSQDWFNNRVWMNPPYDHTLNAWITKAYEESGRGALVVSLLPVWLSERQIFFQIIFKASEIRFVHRRLYFINKGKVSRSNHPSMVVIFRPYSVGPPRLGVIESNGRSN